MPTNGLLDSVPEAEPVPAELVSASSHSVGAYRHSA